jgi:hypothetical protein
MPIKSWIQRIDKMDTTKGVSNVMIQNALKAEVFALRAQINRIRAQRDEWKAAALRYRRQNLKRNTLG